MALDRISMEMIGERAVKRSVLCLGYPDMPDGIDAVGWLDKCGATAVDIVDLIAHKGCERIVDLNEPQEWPRRYGMVINPGTLEHCFNLGQAWANAWAAVDLLGLMMHIAPATMLNHGYWNVSPVAFRDWLNMNGGALIEERFGRNGTAEDVKVEPIKTSKSGRGQLPPETVIYSLGVKVLDRPLKWPTQALYR
jgi:hypothetical protein